MFAWSKALLLTARCLSPLNICLDVRLVLGVAIDCYVSLTTGKGRIPAGACEKVASDLGVSLGTPVSSTAIVCLTRVWQPLFPPFCIKTFEFGLQRWQISLDHYYVYV